MTLCVYFNQTELPRTMTRSEWKFAYRKKRVEERKVREYNERFVQTVRSMSQDECKSDIGKDMIDRMLRPGLVVDVGLFPSLANKTFSF